MAAGWHKLTWLTGGKAGNRGPPQGGYSTKVLATAFVNLLNAAVGSDFASAANVHFKQNRNSTFIDQGNVS